MSEAPKNLGPGTRKYFFEAGQVHGHFRIVQRVRDANTTSPNLRRRWRVECECGTRLTIPEYYMTRKNPKTHCGCKDKTLKTIQFQEYRIWYMMRVRCTDPRHEAFKHYGGRGISVCPQWYDWETGFEQFFKDVGPRPTPKHTIDRINNDGNYEPGNIRWATAKEQRANQRPPKPKS